MKKKQNPALEHYMRFARWFMGQSNDIQEDIKKYCQRKHNYPQLVMEIGGKSSWQAGLDNPDPVERLHAALYFLDDMRGNKAALSACLAENRKHGIPGIFDERIRAATAAAILGISLREFRNRRAETEAEESTLQEFRLSPRDIRYDGYEVALLAIRRELRKKSTTSAS